MSADLLRRAAAVIRETARAATAGPWVADADATGVSIDAPDGTIVAEVFDDGSRVEGFPETVGPNAQHIALWSPAVADDVAAWLFDEAGESERGDRPGAPHPFAVRLARRILGEDA